MHWCGDFKVLPGMEHMHLALASEGADYQTNYLHPRISIIPFGSFGQLDSSPSLNQDNLLNFGSNRRSGFLREPLSQSSAGMRSPTIHRKRLGSMPKGGFSTDMLAGLASQKAIRRQ